MTFYVVYRRNLMISLRADLPSSRGSESRKSVGVIGMDSGLPIIDPETAEPLSLRRVGLGNVPHIRFCACTTTTPLPLPLPPSSSPWQAHWKPSN